MKKIFTVILIGVLATSAIVSVNAMSKGKTSRGQNQTIGTNFVDDNDDGICDNKGTGLGNGQ